MSKFKWTNIFIRDLLLSAVIFWINYTLNYKSFVGAMLVGMMVVLVTWHLNDLIKSVGGLNGIYGQCFSADNIAGNIPDDIQ